MKAWQVVRHARPSDALEVRDVADPTPGPGQLRVATRASSLNFNEIDACYGRYLTVDPPLPYTLGMEVVGIVDVVGDAALDSWLGKRVTAAGAGATGAHAQLVIADAAMAFEAPASLDDAQAAAFFFPFHVAYLSLCSRGGLRPDETLLVHAGSGGVGSAAVQLGHALGARVIATAGGEEKLAFCRSLGADVVIDYRREPFADAVLEATHGRGVDVVCDLVGGDVTQQSLRCLARGGRLMLTGFSGGIEAEDSAALTPRPIIFGNVSVGGVLLAYVPDGAPEHAGLGLLPRSVGERVQRHLIELLDAGRIRTLAKRTAAWTELPIELERIERRDSIGRNALLW
jgi:NADPH2:quinone reductase